MDCLFGVVLRRLNSIVCSEFRICLQESCVIILIVFTRVVLIYFDHWNFRPYEKGETAFCVFWCSYIFMASHPIIWVLTSPCMLINMGMAQGVLRIWIYIYHGAPRIFIKEVFSCDQAALRTTISVCLSVCLSVCDTFFTMFLSLYHHEIFRSDYQWQKWCPCKRSRSEVKGQSHRGHDPI